MTIQLKARHTGEPLTRMRLGLFMEGSPSLAEAEVRHAYQQGLVERASGVRCMCTQCEINRERIVLHEQLRSDYGRRRWDELRAAGIDDLEIQRRIDIEIANGAALNGTTHQEAGR